MGCAGSRSHLRETKIDPALRPLSAQKQITNGTKAVANGAGVSTPLSSKRILQEVPCTNHDANNAHQTDENDKKDSSQRPGMIIRKFSRKSFGDGNEKIAQSEFWRSTVRVLPPQHLTSIHGVFNSTTQIQLTREDSSSPNFDLSVLNWELDPFTYDQEWLMEACFAIFKSEKSFSIQDAVLTSFLATVKLNYHNNPFHNWYHAFSVLQASWMMLQCREISQTLTSLDRLAVMIAAICHDIDHPGVNNDFLAKAKHPIALHYPAPYLENHHAAMTLNILNDDLHRFDILSSLSPPDRDYVVDTVVGGIAATDMGQHKAILEQAEARIERGADGAVCSVRMYDINVREDRQELVQLVLHAADLSAQAFCPSTAYKFGRRVLEEFHAQYGQELSLGVAPSAFMKDLQLPQQQAKTQLGFMNYILKPLWGVLAVLCPEMQIRMDMVEKRIQEVNQEHPDDWVGVVHSLRAYSPERVEELRKDTSGSTLRDRDNKRSSVGQLSLECLSSPLVSEESLVLGRAGSRRSVSETSTKSADGGSNHNSALEL